MQELSIGIQNFEMLRIDNLLYVDKIVQLLKLIKDGRRYFLSRLRRFGKSLTLSTLLMGELNCLTDYLQIICRKLGARTFSKSFVSFEI